jgi:RNA polymerase sigma-54 factor
MGPSNRVLTAVAIGTQFQFQNAGGDIPVAVSKNWAGPSLLRTRGCFGTSWLTMALTTRLMLRQGQSLVMTPQLLQAIKLLQFSSLELVAFVREEVERNPLLEQADETPETPSAEGLGGDFRDDGEQGDPAEGDWSSDQLATDPTTLASDLGTELENAFNADRAPTPAEVPPRPDGLGLSTTAWTGSPGGQGGETPDLEAYVAQPISLRDHLLQQLAIACENPADRLIGQALIDLVDEAGYVTGELDEVALRLGAPTSQIATILRIIQGFDPCGVGSRTLAECLAIQLLENDRFDPAMQALVANLGLLAKRDFAALRKLCGVDDEDLTLMVKEIRHLNPKPGHSFGRAPIQPIVPDIYVWPAADGAWHVELNSEVLPRLLVNHNYYARVSKSATSETDKSFISNCLQTANWLTKSLEQRARTIIKVASEIVRQQDAFLALGIEHLRPLNLKTIADAIGMHESTVSRVTSNKYMSTPRGLFELKYFFTVSIASSAGGDAHSAEAVRFKIKQMIDQETTEEVLSDDAIVLRLKAANIDIARRTVAKYREALRIPSSVERRREKQAMRQPHSLMY